MQRQTTFNRAFSKIQPVNSTKSGEESDEKEPAKEKNLRNLLFEVENQVENGISSKLQFTRFRLLSAVTLLHNIYTVLLSVTYYELNTKQPNGSTHQTIILYLIFTDVVLLIGCIIIRNIFYFYYQKERKLINSNYTYLMSGRTFYTILNIAICLLIPNPIFHLKQVESFNYETGIIYTRSMNDVMVILTFLRVIPIIGCATTLSRHYSVRQQRVCQLIGTKTTFIFTLKCIINNNRFQFLGVTIALSIFFFTFVMRVCELPLTRALQDFNFDHYTTVMWQVIVTMTTVGYGDYYPRTIPGRAFAFLLCIWGVFIMSLMVITQQETLTQNDLERKVLTHYERITLRKQVKDRAVNCLVYFVKTNRSMRKNSEIMKKWYYSKLALSMREFKYARECYNYHQKGEEGFLSNIAKYIGILRSNIMAQGWRQDRLINYSNFMEIYCINDPVEQADQLNQVPTDQGGLIMSRTGANAPKQFLNVVNEENSPGYAKQQKLTAFDKEIREASDQLQSQNRTINSAKGGIGNQGGIQHVKKSYLPSPKELLTDSKTIQKMKAKQNKYTAKNKFKTGQKDQLQDDMNGSRLKDKNSNDRSKYSYLNNKIEHQIGAIIEESEERFMAEE